MILPPVSMVAIPSTVHCVSRPSVTLVWLIVKPLAEEEGQRERGEGRGEGGEGE